MNTIADVIHVDRDKVRQRAGLAETFGPDMPAGAMQWAAVAAERGLNTDLEVHRARIPDDLLHRLTEPSGLEVPEPWGPPDAWLPINPPAVGPVGPRGRAVGLIKVRIDALLDAIALHVATRSRCAPT